MSAGSRPVYRPAPLGDMNFFNSPPSMVGAGAPSQIGGCYQPMPDAARPPACGVPFAAIGGARGLVFGLILAVVVATLVIVTYMLRERRLRSKGPYSKHIDGETDKDKRAELLEWQYLLQVTKHKDIRQTMNEVILERLRPEQALPPSQATASALSAPPAPEAPVAPTPPPSGAESDDPFGTSIDDL